MGPPDGTTAHPVLAFVTPRSRKSLNLYNWIAVNHFG
jgi:hypothetical protein